MRWREYGRWFGARWDERQIECRGEAVTLVVPSACISGLRRGTAAAHAAGFVLVGTWQAGVKMEPLSELVGAFPQGAWRSPMLPPLTAPMDEGIWAPPDVWQRLWADTQRPPLAPPCGDERLRSLLWRPRG